MENDRRIFLKQLATVTGGVVLMPYVISCGSTPAMTADVPSEADMKANAEGAADQAMATASQGAIPVVRPQDWEPVAYNTARGNAGAIPESYLGDVNGPDGPMKHIGKHLPYVPQVEAGMVPAGFVAIMWGDPAKGHAKHPNAAKSDKNPDGHWYNWIKVRKAVEGEAEELQSVYTDWPGTQENNGAYAVFGGGEITAEDGKNTIYLAALPKDVAPGDTVRIHAHCLTHGEYVDFLTV